MEKEEGGRILILRSASVSSSHLKIAFQFRPIAFADAQ
jgi:hypothetical protein